MSPEDSDILVGVAAVPLFKLILVVEVRFLPRITKEPPAAIVVGNISIISGD